MTPETHLFILWEFARGEQTRILEDMADRFVILRVLEVRWSAPRFSRNLSRFYGQKLPAGSGKEQHCGTGPFLLVVVRDVAPVYEERRTSKGPATVNGRTFDAKSRYREWTGGGHRVHGTNSETETEHDLTLLTGLCVDAFLRANPGPWDGEIGALHGDLVGTGGWDDLRQFFRVLDTCARYVVLRNFEPLPDAYYADSHGDVDLLTDDAVELAFVADAQAVFRPRHRVHYRVRIAGEEVLFDFRFVGDGYYDAAWERDVLARRVRNPRGFWTPDGDDHFHSLLYHALVHKPVVSTDYVARLAGMASALGVPDGDSIDFTDLASARVPLDAYLRRNGYDYTEPRDLSVFVNPRMIPAVRFSVRRRAVQLVGAATRRVKRLFR